MFEESKSCGSLRVCRRGREQPVPHKLSDMIAVLARLAAVTEPDVDKVNARCVNDGKRAGFGVRTRIPSVVTELYA